WNRKPQRRLCSISREEKLMNWKRFRNWRYALPNLVFVLATCTTTNLWAHLLVLQNEAGEIYGRIIKIDWKNGNIITIQRGCRSDQTINIEWQRVEAIQFDAPCASGGPPAGDQDSINDRSDRNCPAGTHQMVTKVQFTTREEAVIAPNGIDIN